MTEQVIIDWLLQSLPPESGPYLQWLAANYQTAQPLLLLFFLIVILAEAWIIATVLRWLR